MAVISSLRDFTAFASKFKQVSAHLSTFQTENSSEINRGIQNAVTFIEMLEIIFKELDKTGFLGDYWLLSTFSRLPKAAMLQGAAQFTGEIIPLIPLPVTKVTSTLPASKTAKALILLKKNKKISAIVNRFNLLKQREFETKLDSEMQKIPEDTPTSVIQDFKTFFANTQRDWEQFLVYTKEKELEEEGRRKLEVHRARLKEKLTKEQIKHQQEEFEDSGGYEAIEQDQIEKVRKKALPAKKQAKKVKLSPEIEEKIEQKKLKDELRAESEDRTQKFFKEKKKLQQDYVEKLKKLQDKRKG